MSAQRSVDGRFIVLEGLDGAGTTTQTERIAAALGEEGHRVLVTREPSEGPIGSQIRLALGGRLDLVSGRGALGEDSLALLFAADRLDHLEWVVEPAIARGEVVVCDRYVLSSLAYQGSALPMEWVEQINSRARAADLTLFIEVGVATAARRRAARGAAAELFEVDDRQERIARQYGEAIRRRSTSERIVRIDGERSIESVTREALAAIAPILRGGHAARGGRRA